MESENIIFSFSKAFYIQLASFFQFLPVGFSGNVGCFLVTDKATAEGRSFSRGVWEEHATKRFLKIELQIELCYRSRAIFTVFSLL